MFRLCKYFEKNVFKGHYETKMKEIVLKEYEPQEAKRRVFMSLKRLNKVFSVKERKLSVHDMCIF